MKKSMNVRITKSKAYGDKAICFCKTVQKSQVKTDKGLSVWNPFIPWIDKRGRIRVKRNILPGMDYEIFVKTPGDGAVKLEKRNYARFQNFFQIEVKNSDKVTSFKTKIKSPNSKSFPLFSKKTIRTESFFQNNIVISGEDNKRFFSGNKRLKNREKELKGIFRVKRGKNLENISFYTDLKLFSCLRESFKNRGKALFKVSWCPGMGKPLGIKNLRGIRECLPNLTRVKKTFQFSGTTGNKIFKRIENSFYVNSFGRSREELTDLMKKGFLLFGFRFKVFQKTSCCRQTQWSRSTCTKQKYIHNQSITQRTSLTKT